MNAGQLHRLMTEGLAGTARQMAISLGHNEKSIRRCLGELAAEGLVQSDGKASALNNRAGGLKPRVWRARAFSQE